MSEQTKKLRGFALMKARGDDISAIGRKGGKAAHVMGKAHEFTSEEAKAAGRKGGLATAKKNKQASPHTLHSHSPRQ
jgi:general stress protein YciG